MAGVRLPTIDWSHVDVARLLENMDHLNANVNEYAEKRFDYARQLIDEYNRRFPKRRVRNPFAEAAALDAAPAEPALALDGKPQLLTSGAAAGVGEAGVPTISLAGRQGDDDDRLAAAATPVTPDPSLRGRPAADAAATLRSRMLAAGYTEDEADSMIRQESGMEHAFALPPSDDALRRGVAYQRGQDQRVGAFNRSLDGAYGAPASAATKPGMFTGSHGATYSREANGSAYAPLTNFQPGATVMVDGVEVPAFDVGDGTLRYRLGDVKRAQEAAHNSRLAAMFSESAQEDLANYGTRQLYEYKRDEKGNLIPGRGTPIPTTGDLNDPNAEDKSYPTLTPDEAAQQDNLATRRDMEYRQAEQNRMLRSRTAGKSDAMEAENRAFMRRRNLLAGGSQNITSDNRGMWNQLALLPAEDQIRQLSYALPGGSLRAGVDARQLDQAARFAQQAITGALAGAGQADMAGRVAAQRSRDLARDDFDKWFDKNVGTTPGAVRYYTWDQYDAQVAFLMNQFGISRPEAESIAGSRGRPSVSRSAGAATPSAGATTVGPDTDSDANPLPTTTW